MEIKNFDKHNLTTMRMEINNALIDVAKKYNVKFELGNIRFTTNNFRCKLECNTNQVPEVPEAIYVDQFSVRDEGKPTIGKTYSIGDHRNGHLKVTVDKNRRTKAECTIVEILSRGTRPKTASFEAGHKIRVPFTAFKGK